MDPDLMPVCISFTLFSQTITQYHYCCSHLLHQIKKKKLVKVIENQHSAIKNFSRRKESKNKEKFSIVLNHKTHEALINGFVVWQYTFIDVRNILSHPLMRRKFLRFFRFFPSKNEKKNRPANVVWFKKNRKFRNIQRIWKEKPYNVSNGYRSKSDLICPVLKDKFPFVWMMMFCHFNITTNKKMSREKRKYGNLEPIVLSLGRISKWIFEFMVLHLWNWT